MTLRYINADEIASNMLDVLGNKEFQSIHKKASFSKKANDEEALKEALEELDFDDKEGFGEVANEDLEIEEPMDEEDFEEENYWGKPDTSEEEGDDERLNDEIREEEEAGRDKILDDDLYMDAHEDDFKEATDFATEAALKFTKKNLVKLSNLLDSKGFAGIANVVDGAMVKLSASPDMVEDAPITKRPVR